MRFWLLLPGSILLISGILMMFAVGFNFVVAAFGSGGLLAVTIWHLVLPLIPTALGLCMVLLAPTRKGSE